MIKNFVLATTLIALSTVAGAAQTGIRKVDFKNFTYNVNCIGENPSKVTVKDGKFEKKGKPATQDEIPDYFYFGIYEDIAYGDLNGDGAEEAVILGSCNTGGSGNFSEGFVYSLAKNKPVLLANIAGGDRADGGLRAAKIEKGLLVLDINDTGELGGACCPEVVITTKLKLTGKKLTQVGKATQKELYPAQRIAFAKGAKSSVNKITLEKYDQKRFVINARAGQTLRVVLDSKDVSAGIIKGEADVTENSNGFTAKLTKSGDFLISVSNGAEASRAVGVTFEVR